DRNEIGFAIAIEVANGNLLRTRADRKIAHAGEVAIAGSPQNGDGIVPGVGRNDIRFVIVIKVGDNDVSGSFSDGKVRSPPQRSVAIAAQNADRVEVVVVVIG